MAADDSLAGAESRELVLPVAVEATCVGVVVSEVAGPVDTGGVEAVVGCESEVGGEVAVREKLVKAVRSVRTENAR